MIESITDADRMAAMKRRRLVTTAENGRWVLDSQTDSTITTSAPVAAPARRVAEAFLLQCPTRSTLTVGTSGQRPTPETPAAYANDLPLY